MSRFEITMSGFRIVRFKVLIVQFPIIYFRIDELSDFETSENRIFECYNYLFSVSDIRCSIEFQTLIFYVQLNLFQLHFNLPFQVTFLRVSCKLHLQATFLRYLFK